MFRVILADDEKRICVLLEKSIRWKELGLEPVASCSNGQELFEAVAEHRPDIVITDIQMPGMNGIDAIKSIRENGNDCKIIIISGYQEFAYAHNALKYNVTDYLLKPIDADELNESLRKITLELSSRSGGGSSVAAPAEKDFRDHFISVFLPMIVKQGCASLDNVNSDYGMHFSEGRFQGLYLYIDTGREVPEVGSLNSLIVKLRDICTTVLSEVCSEVVFSESGSGLLIGINYTGPETMPHHFRQLFDRVSPVIELFFDFGLTIGIGEPVDTLSQLGRSLEQAQEIIRYRSALGRNKLIYWNELKDRLDKMQSIKELQDSIIPVARAFEVCSSSMFCQTYDSFLDDFAQERLLLDFLFIEKVCGVFNNFMSTNFPQHEKTASIKRQLDFELMHCSSIPELAKTIRRVVISTLDEFNQQLADKENLPIRQAKEYIYHNYSHPIRLEDIAAAVYLSPAYLSNIFKKVTGKNLVNFINEYRVEQAKKLLVSTNMTVEEIANAVGFDSHRYFGNIFRKTLGIKPSEYRKLYQ